MLHLQRNFWHSTRSRNFKLLLYLWTGPLLWSLF